MCEKFEGNILRMNMVHWIAMLHEHNSARNMTGRTANNHKGCIPGAEVSVNFTYPSSSCYSEATPSTEIYIPICKGKQKFYSLLYLFCNFK